MRIALHNPYDDPNLAEVESAKRFIKTAQRIGHEAVMVHRAYQIRELRPDLVISMSYQVPKLTKYPTYGILTAPTSYFEQTQRFINNILSYDGYLTLSATVQDWISDYLFAIRKPVFLTDFAFTCHATTFREPCIDKAELAYFGTNWDGQRHGALFKALSNRDYMQCYGPPDKWMHIHAKARKGGVPFDGSSSLSVYNQAGAGLCLHLEEFKNEDTPSNRIFEICASGAVLITDRVPIVEKIFGDSVFYLDDQLPLEETVKQVDTYMDWIHAHKDQATLMAKNAHRLFNDYFSLEVLIPRIIEMHREVTRKKRCISLPNHPDDHRAAMVSIIVRTGGRPLCYLQRCLDSIGSQTWPNIEVIVVNYQNVEGLEEALAAYQKRLKVRIVEKLGGNRSATLWAGLNEIQGDCFAILDDDDCYHPNHIAGLMAWMKKEGEDASLVYTGVLDILEPPLEETDVHHPEDSILWPLEKNDNYQIPYQDDTRTVHFHKFDPEKFVQGTNYVAPNAFLARSSLLDEQILEDPNLHFGEDYLLVLLLFDKCKFIFTWELTTEHRERVNCGDNSQYWHPHNIAITQSKIRRRLFGRYYCGQTFAFQPAADRFFAQTAQGNEAMNIRDHIRTIRQERHRHIPFHRRVIRFVKDLFFV